MEWRQVESKPSAGLLLLAGCLKIASATTIVAIRTPDEVVIAADSAATIQGDGRPRTTGAVRKIYEVDASLFFAVSDLVSGMGVGAPITIAKNGRNEGCERCSLQLRGPPRSGPMRPSGDPGGLVRRAQ